MIVSNFLSEYCELVTRVVTTGSVPEDHSLAITEYAIKQVTTRLGATTPWTERCRKALAIIGPELERAKNLRLAEAKARENERRERKHQKNLRRQANQAVKAEENRARAQKGGCKQSRKAK